MKLYAITASFSLCLLFGLVLKFFKKLPPGDGFKINLAIVLVLGSLSFGFWIWERRQRARREYSWPAT